MPPIKVFIGYSRTDNEYLQALKKHLAPLEKAARIQVWYDGDLSPGDEWDAKIKHNLATADLILLLISSDALSSDYFHDKEMKKALKRDEQKEAVVIPIIVRPCLWDDTPIHQLQALPQDGKAIILWEHHDVAYDNIVRGIKAAIENLLETRKPQLAILKASILHLLEQNKLEQAQQTLQKAHALNLPDPELDKLQTDHDKNEQERLKAEREEAEQLRQKKQKRLENEQYKRKQQTEQDRLNRESEEAKNKKQFWQQLQAADELYTQQKYAQAQTAYENLLNWDNKTDLINIDTQTRLRRRIISCKIKIQPRLWELTKRTKPPNK